MDEKERVAIFIDANNFRQVMNGYYGKHSFDVVKLVKLLLNGRNSNKIFYYINRFKLNKEDIAKQERFFAAIQRKVPGLEVKAFDMQKRKDAEGYQEKGVDNAITLDMALELSSYDTAILVTEDSDYVGTVQRIIGLGKKVELALPHFAKGHHLRKNCTSVRVLSEEELNGILMSNPRNS
ncbi:NYN domain-containing protein [Priestia aryabhattai]|uniref:NYN domain-containing protein n=1 Tax=Priestia aryabhattai TaxID=412384 RepID=UPI001C8E4313|nr:NYN domain-containing protein [Priestia aryabhattai]MBY0031035.1 NYN domain-containing protein [Priestia aryabhattai]